MSWGIVRVSEDIVWFGHTEGFSARSRIHGSGGTQGGYIPIGTVVPSTCCTRNATKYGGRSVPVTLGKMGANGLALTTLRPT